MDRALLEMVYFTDGDRHTLNLHVLPVALDPVGVLGDFVYNTPPPAPGAERGVLDTFSFIAPLWSAFYPPRWTLQLVGVWEQNGDVYNLLPTVPFQEPISGTDTTAPLGYEAVQRRYSLYAGGRRVRRLHLRQMPGTQVGLTANVRADSGGLDVRDQNLLRYLSGSRTAALAPDGDTFVGTALVRALRDRPVLPLTTIA